MKQICLLLTIFICTGSIAQDNIVFRLEKTINGRFVDFQADPLGNYYLLDEQNQLKKLNPRGDSMGVFNEVRRYGKLSSIDASNPLKVLLYYRNFSTIVVLDRFMGVVNTIDLRKAGVFRVKAIAQSYDNQIWVFDEQENKLKKVDESGNTLTASVDFRMLFDEVPTPTQIIDQEGFVYLYDPAKGVYVFDIYGAFKTKLSYPALNAFSVIGKTIMGISEAKLLFYTMGTLSEKNVSLPAELDGKEKTVIRPGKYYVLKEGEIRLYRF